jgi:hypothetical protein
LDFFIVGLRVKAAISCLNPHERYAAGHTLPQIGGYNRGMTLRRIAGYAILSTLTIALVTAGVISYGAVNFAGALVIVVAFLGAEFIGLWLLWGDS